MTYLSITNLNLMSQVNLVKALTVNRAIRFALNRDQTPSVDIKSSIF